VADEGVWGYKGTETTPVERGKKKKLLIKEAIENTSKKVRGPLLVEVLQDPRQKKNFLHIGRGGIKADRKPHDL